MFSDDIRNKTSANITTMHEFLNNGQPHPPEYGER